MRRPKGAARPRFHTHVYTHGSRHRPHLGLPRPPIKGRLVVLCDVDRLATRLFLVPFLSAASIPRGPVPGDPLSHHVEAGTTQECVRVRHPRAVAIPPRRPRHAPKGRRDLASPNTWRSWDPHVLRCTITVPLTPPWSTDLFNRSTQEPRRVSLHRRLFRPNGRSHARERPRPAPEGRRDPALPQCRGIHCAPRCTQGGEGWVLERSPHTVYTGWVRKVLRMSRWGSRGAPNQRFCMGRFAVGLERSPWSKF